MATQAEIATIVQDDMRRAVIEARHLGLAEKQEDFIALLLSISQDMQVLSDKYYQFANLNISERTDTIENICTSVDDKDIDDWLDVQEQEPRVNTDKPYTCLECGLALSFPDTIFYDDLPYCKEHAPEYRKDEQF